MNRLAVIGLMASMLAGCFTVTGGVIGSQVKTREATRLPTGALVVSESSSVVSGLVVGALLDAALVFAVSSAASSSDSCFTYGPGEGQSPSGC